MKRREWLARAAGAGAALGLGPRLAGAAARGAEAWARLPQGPLIRHPIPVTGELLPVIGLGSSATFASVARSEDVSALKEVFRVLVDRGASLFDTAPGYGASEDVAGGIVNDLGIRDRIFWATKLNVAGRGGASADPSAARMQLEQSFARVQKAKIDLVQVHNMGDPATQLPILHDAKAAGRIRYVGITTTFPQQYPQLIDVMKRESLDFIGIDYAADNRDVEEVILPLARDKGIAVLAYAPFGRTSLFRRVGDQPVPEWAAEFDATTWPQVFLKYVISHPAITAVTPATSQARHMVDNLAGGIGRVPDAAMRARVERFVDALPAPAR